MSAQETNQRKRLGDALAAKSFVIAEVIQHIRPTLSRPPPDPYQAPVEEKAVIVFIVDTRVRIVDTAFLILGISATAMLPTSAGKGT